VSYTDRPLQESNPVIQEYSHLADRYDTKWSFYIQATTQETLARIKLRSNDRILDIGCGTGALLEQIASNYPQSQLFGVDPVAEMLAIARQKLPSNTELKQGWAEALPFDGEQFDVVVSCNMFHYICQPVIALQEMHRVLRSNGQLIITDWCDDYWTCRICDRLLRLFNRAHFKTYRQQELQEILVDAGYTDVRIERYKINWMWGLMTAKTVKSSA
jgi:ubiquinone/menaquinone biosynthesis C-methylase UbiE